MVSQGAVAYPTLGLSPWRSIDLPVCVFPWLVVCRSGSHTCSHRRNAVKKHTKEIAKIPSYTRELAHARVATQPSQHTRQQYDRILRYMDRHTLSISDFKTKAQFDVARAALTLAAAEHVLAVDAELQHSQRSLTNSECSEIGACIAVLLKFPPENAPPPTPDLARLGPYYEDPQRAQFAKPNKQDKRSALRALKRRAEFVDGSIFERVWERGVCVLPIAVLMAAGPRPSEIASGITVRVIGEAARPMLSLTVPGSKTDGISRGYAWRQLVYDTPSAHPTTHVLLQHARLHGGAILVHSHPDRLRQSLKHAAVAVLGPSGHVVSPYVYRHAFASRIRATYELGQAARALGHASSRSTRHYRGGRDGGPCPASVVVPGREPRSDHKPSRPQRPEPGAHLTM